MGLGAGVLLTLVLLAGWRVTLATEQRVNLQAYAKASMKAAVKLPNFAGRKPKPNRNVYVRDALRERVYGGVPLLKFCMVPLISGGVLMIGLWIFGSTRDSRFIRQLRRGVLRQGPVLFRTRAQMRKVIEADGEQPGIGFRLMNARTAQELSMGDEGGVLRIPLKHEAHHMMVSASTGAGKTQLIMQVVDQINDRRATDCAIIADPTGVLYERYGRPGDINLNVFDERAVSWNPVDELTGMNTLDEAYAEAMGKSLFVGRAASTADGGDFFSRASGEIWTELVAHCRPKSAQELAAWLGDEDKIDLLLEGKAAATQFPKGAPQQRSAVHASLGMVQRALAAIPTPDQAQQWSVRGFCEHRTSWVFLTSTPKTRESLRPLHSLWIDMLIREFISQGDRPDLPRVWFILDELAALQRLPMLGAGLSEGRKFGLRFVIGIQAFSQVVHDYGQDDAQTIMSAPNLQIYLRTNEFKCAELASNQCGAQRLEKMVESFPANKKKGSGGTVSTREVTEPVFIPSVFMGLKDLHGVLKYSGVGLLKIKLPILPRLKGCEAFIPRADIATRITEMPAPDLLNEETKPAKGFLKNKPKPKAGKGSQPAGEAA